MTSETRSDIQVPFKHPLFIRCVMASVIAAHAAPIIVHHLQASRSRKMLWLLEELGVAYEIKYYERVKGLAPPELIKVHPLGKSPVISDGDLTLAESGAITEYLCETYDTAGALHPLPSDRRNAIDHRYWLHYGEGSLASFLVLDLIMVRIEKNSPWIIGPIARGITGAVRSSYLDENLERHAAFLETSVAKGGGYLVGGKFTAADVHCSGFIARLLEKPKFAASCPGLVAYIAKIRARPAFKRATERSRPYEGDAVDSNAI